MKHKIKQIFCIICSMVLMIPCTTMAAENQASSYNEKINYLHEKGIEESILQELSEKCIDDIYQKVIEKYHGDVQISSQIVEIDDQQDSSERANINKANLRFTAVLNNYIHPSTGDILGCDIALSYEWLNTPTTTGPDAITINWDPTYFHCTEGYGFSSHNYSINTTTGNKEFFNFSNTPALINKGGVGWYVNLLNPNISEELQSNYGGGAMVNFEPNYTFRPEDYIITNFTILYTQNKTSQTDALSIIADNNGVKAEGESIDTLRTIIRYNSSIQTET